MIPLASRAELVIVLLFWICQKEHRSMKCPFTYANGRCCSGTIQQARAYGRQTNGTVVADDIRKIRLWCSEKWDHAGAVSSWDAKLRMEFYPDELMKLGLYDEAVRLCENVAISEGAR